MSSGLQGLFKVNPTAGAEEAAKLESSENVDLLVGVASIYAAQGDQEKLGFFEEKLAKVDNQQAGEFAAAYIGLAIQGGPGDDQIGDRPPGDAGYGSEDEPLPTLQLHVGPGGAAEHRGGSGFVQRSCSGENLTSLLTEKINAIKAAETNPQLQGAFSGM